MDKDEINKEIEETLVAFGKAVAEWGAKEEAKEKKKLSKSYYDYIESQAWQAKRSKRLMIDNLTCQRCGSKKDVQVHHLTYENFGNEDVYNDLITLCKRCHEDVEREKEKNKAPTDIVLREIKRMENIEQIREYAQKQKELEAEQAFQKKKQEEEQARERYIERRRTQLINTHKFLALVKGRDIGEGGKDNLCNRDRLIEILAEFGYEIDDVEKWFIHSEVVYNRWCLARRLHQEGLNVSEIAREMGWTYNKVKKAIDESSEHNFKGMVIKHTEREDILNRAITGGEIYINE
jgi:uncharacterized protein YnzC (UPF0291/DUF896 family)